MAQIGPGRGSTGLGSDAHQVLGEPRQRQLVGTPGSGLVEETLGNERLEQVPGARGVTAHLAGDGRQGVARGPRPDHEPCEREEKLLLVRTGELESGRVEALLKHRLGEGMDRLHVSEADGVILPVDPRELAVDLDEVRITLREVIAASSSFGREIAVVEPRRLPERADRLVAGEGDDPRVAEPFGVLAGTLTEQLRLRQTRGDERDRKAVLRGRVLAVLQLVERVDDGSQAVLGQELDLVEDEEHGDAPRELGHLRQDVRQVLLEAPGQGLLPAPERHRQEACLDLGLLEPVEQTLHLPGQGLAAEDLGLNLVEGLSEDPTQVGLRRHLLPLGDRPSPVRRDVAEPVQERALADAWEPEQDHGRRRPVGLPLREGDLELADVLLTSDEQSGPGRARAEWVGVAVADQGSSPPVRVERASRQSRSERSMRDERLTILAESWVKATSGGCRDRR